MLLNHLWLGATEQAGRDQFKQPLLITKTDFLSSDKQNSSTSNILLFFFVFPCHFSPQIESLNSFVSLFPCFSHTYPNHVPISFLIPSYCFTPHFVSWVILAFVNLQEPGNCSLPEFIFLEWYHSGHSVSLCRWRNWVLKVNNLPSDALLFIFTVETRIQIWLDHPRPLIFSLQL